MTDLRELDMRVSLLRWLLIILIIVMVPIMILVFAVNPSASGTRLFYALMVGSLLLLLCIAFGLLLAGYYRVSAIITVLSPMLGAWGSLIFDPSVGHGDMFPLLYVVFSIMLSSLLLPQVVTVTLATVQFLLLVLTVAIFPALRPLNWMSFLIFIFIAFVLSIITNRMLGDQLANLRTFAITDELTGLLNRRYFGVALDQELTVAKRELQDEKDPLFGVILLDIDNFKGLNDHHGHPAGDLVLSKFARFLHRTLSLDCIVCRYGGDEFAMIVHSQRVEELISIAENLRSKVKNLELNYRGENIGPISITLGVAQFPEHGVTKVSLVLHADESLMRAKREGRDRIGF